MITKRKPPYQSTDVDPFKTQGQIQKMLQDYGAEAVSWVSDFTNNQVQLSFLIEIELHGVKRKIGVQIKPPTFLGTHKTWSSTKGYQKVHAPNWQQSMRLLYYYLKAKLEAISYGLVDAEKEFFAQVITKLPSGEQGTVWDLIGKSAIENQLQAPEPETRKEKIIEAEFESQ